MMTINFYELQTWKKQNCLGRVACDGVLAEIEDKRLEERYLHAHGMEVAVLESQTFGELQVSHTPGKNRWRVETLRP